MPNPFVRHVLIIDHRGDALAAYFAARRSDLVCRVRSATALTPGDQAWADAVVGFSPPGSLERSSFRWVHSTGAGVDAWLDTPSWPNGVTLTRTTGELGVRMAEYCVGHALAVSQRIAPFYRDQEAGQWTPVEPSTMRGTTAVVLGTGSVGSAIAAGFHAVGCRTIGISRSGRPASGFDAVYPVDRLADRVVDARWLVLAAPLTPVTRQIVGAAVLAQCRDTVLINVARGGLLDTAAVLDALRTGALAGAVLDVFDTEPLQPDSPLWRTSGVVVTPHIAGVTHVEEAGAAFLDALAHLESGRRPPSTVDPARGY